MKKLLAILLAVVLTLTMAVVVFAANDVTSDGGTDTGNVDVDIKKPGDMPNTSDDDLDDVDPRDATYRIDLTGIDGLTFEYTHGNYNADTMKYENGSWTSETSKTIKVENRSNTTVGISAKFPSSADSATKDGVTATLTNNVFDLKSAVDETTAPNNTITVAVTGAPEVATAYTVNTITLTVTGKN